MSKSAKEVAIEFIQAINSHSPDALAGLMTENHCFVDSTGANHQGREQMRGGWGYYFSMFPDYHMVVETSIESGSVAALFGKASGTHSAGGPDDHWEIPFAIRAVVESGKVQEWRVYADNHVVYQILERNRG